MLEAKEAEKLIASFLEAKKKQGWGTHPQDPTYGFLRKDGAVNVYAIVNSQVACVSIKAEKLEEIIPKVQYPDLYREIAKMREQVQEEAPRMEPPSKEETWTIPATTLVILNSLPAHNRDVALAFVKKHMLSRIPAAQLARILRDDNPYLTEPVLQEKLSLPAAAKLLEVDANQWSRIVPELVKMPLKEQRKRVVQFITTLESTEPAKMPAPKEQGPTLGDRALQAAHAAANMEAETASKVLATGNLELLSPVQKVQYYNAVCQSLGLNPLTRPFDYITFWRGKSKVTQLYAKRDCTDQLRAIHQISVEFVDRRTENGIYIVTAKATTPEGRSDVSTGAKALSGMDRDGHPYQLAGDSLANAMMTAETKAKRRVTLSICGLGFLDETEVATIPGAEGGL